LNAEDDRQETPRNRRDLRKNVNGNEPRKLDYATPQRHEWPVWIAVPCLLFWMYFWALILGGIWAMAFLGPLLVVVGIVNILHPIHALGIFEHGFGTTGEKLQFVVRNSAVSLVAIAALVLIRRYRYRGDK
jgi:hypothetical protein